MLLVALWRGRRIGPLVAEELPVVVRASETVEGRGRLYRSRRARDRAAQALRTATLQRMLPRLGLGADTSAPAPWCSRSPRSAAGFPQSRCSTSCSARPPTDRCRTGEPRPCTRRHRKAGRTLDDSIAPHAPISRRPGIGARNALLALRAEIAKAVVGQDAVVSGLVIALLCRGHVLLEGVPGVAKTLLVRTLAAALQLEFKRVQFTPDLMPGDVTGSLVYDARTAEFEFRAGPVFTNLLLADEINRTPPKTQAALLEAMEERQVSVDGEPRPLPDPFIVAATQNPIEYEGTYQLPEAQLDRFLLKLNVPLPPREQEIAILDRHARGFDPRDLSAIARSPGRPSWPRAARRCARCWSPTRCWATSSTSPARPGTRRHCSSACRRAARRRCWPPRGPGRGCRAATTSRPTTSRRWPGRRCGTASRCGRGRTGGRHPRRRARRHPGLGPGAALVILTGRAGLIALICVLPIALSPWPAATFVVLLALLLSRSSPTSALAASTARLAVQPRSATPPRGSASPSTPVLIVEQRRHGAEFRGQVRDAWAPSARAEPRTHAVDIAGGQRVRRRHRLRPVRRGDQRSALVTARSIGPLGLAGRQSSHRVPWQVRILPPFLSRKHLPSRLAKLREIDGLIPVLIRGQGTEFDSLREYVVGDDVRSIDWRATARRADVVVRTWRPERDRRVVIVLDTGRTSAGRVGVDPTAGDPERLAAAGLVDGRRTAAGGVGVPSRRPRRLPRPRPGHPGRRLQRVAHRTAAPSWSRRWRRCSPRWSNRTPPQWLPRCSAAPGGGRWWCC